MPEGRAVVIYRKIDGAFISAICRLITGCGGSGLGVVIVAASIGGIILAVLMTIGKRVRISSFILNILCTAGIAVTAAGLKMWIPALNMDTVIISCIMPLVPGVAITNAIRDTLRGDYISGGARALEAFVTAAAVAIGAGVGMASMNLFLQGGGLW